MTQENKPFILKDNDNIFKKIHGMMSEIGFVSKKGFNDNQNYKFAKETDFVEAIQPLLVKYRLIMLPNLKSLTIREYGEDKATKAKVQFLTTVEMEYTIIDIDTKEREIICLPGQGADNRDKGVYKALTGAKKYSHSTTFVISTGDDPEANSPQDKEKTTKVVSKPEAKKSGSGKRNTNVF